MKYLIVLLLCILAATKVSIQTSFGKSRIKTVSDSLFFNAMVFGLSALIFMPSVSEASTGVWIHAFAFGIFTVPFQLTYTIALSKGSVSLTVMLVNFSMIVPVAFSVPALWRNSQHIQNCCSADNTFGVYPYN